VRTPITGIALCARNSEPGHAAIAPARTVMKIAASQAQVLDLAVSTEMLTGREQIAVFPPRLNNWLAPAMSSASYVRVHAGSEVDAADQLDQ
jgi:hypothetical protein